MKSREMKKRHHCDAKLMLRNTEAFSSRGRHTLLTSPGDRASPSVLQPAAHEVYSERKEHWALGCPGKKKEQLWSERAYLESSSGPRALWRMFLARELASVWANYRLNEALLDGGGGTMPQPFSIPTTLHFHARVGVKNQPKLGGTSRYEQPR